MAPHRKKAPKFTVTEPEKEKAKSDFLKRRPQEGDALLREVPKVVAWTDETTRLFECDAWVRSFSESVLKAQIVVPELPDLGPGFIVNAACCAAADSCDLGRSRPRRSRS